MIKKLIAMTAVLAALIAAYCGASLWSGLRIESQSFAAVDAINLHLARTWSDQIRLSAREYQRGIFSSQASYVLTFPPKQGSATSHKRELLFINQITHGPYPLKNILSGDFSAVGALIKTVSAPTPWTEDLFNANALRPLVIGHTRVSPDGVARLNLSAAPFNFRQDALRIQFGGAQLKAEVSSRFRHRKGEFTLEALNVTDGQATLDLKAAKMEMDARLTTSGIPLGVHRREIGSLSWTSVNAPTIELEKFRLRTELELDDAGVDGSTQLDIGALSIAQQKLGAVKLSLNYDRLSDRALSPLLELYNRTLSRLASHILAPEPLSTTDIKKIWFQLQDLLKSRPAIRIDPLVWETAAGKSQLTLNTILNPADLASSGVGLRESPIDTLDATLTISQPMVNGLVLQKFQTPGANSTKVKGLADRELRRLTDLAMQLKLGRVQNGRLVSHFNVQDGELRINGQRTPADPILNLLSSFIPPAYLASKSTAPGQVGPDEAASLQHLDPEVLAAILTDADFTYKESRDADGDLVLKVTPGDSGAESIEIIFSGCRKDPTCEDVLLRATYAANQVAPLKFVNDWNLRNRWARVFLKESGAPVLEMDISAYGGVGQDAIESMVGTFFKLVRDFSAALKTAEQAAQKAASDATAPAAEGSVKDRAQQPGPDSSAPASSTAPAQK